MKPKRPKKLLYKKLSLIDHQSPATVELEWFDLRRDKLVRRFERLDQTSTKNLQYLWDVEDLEKEDNDLTELQVTAELNIEPKALETQKVRDFYKNAAELMRHGSQKVVFVDQETKMEVDSEFTN